jgi:hypothetical protein
LWACRQVFDQDLGLEEGVERLQSRPVTSFSAIAATWLQGVPVRNETLFVLRHDAGGGALAESSAAQPLTIGIRREVGGVHGHVTPEVGHLSAERVTDPVRQASSNGLCSRSFRAKR